MGIRGEKCNSKAAKGGKEHFTLLPCICADGTSAPPLIITRGVVGSLPEWLAEIQPQLAGTAFAKMKFAQQVRFRFFGTTCTCHMKRA